MAFICSKLVLEQVLVLVLCTEGANRGLIQRVLVLKLKFLALKKLVFSGMKYFPKFFWLLFIFIQCNFSVRTLQYFQKKCLTDFLPSKVAHNWPKPFFSQSSPQPSPQPRIDFSYYKYVPKHICLLIFGFMYWSLIGGGYSNQKGLLIFVGAFGK